MIPDTASPDFITFAAVIFAFIGVTIARWRGDPDLGPWIAEWTYLGVAFGLAFFLGELKP